MQVLTDAEIANLFKKLHDLPWMPETPAGGWQWERYIERAILKKIKYKG